MDSGRLKGVSRVKQVDAVHIRLFGVAEFRGSLALKLPCSEKKNNY